MKISNKMNLSAAVLLGFGLLTACQTNPSVVNNSTNNQPAVNKSAINISPPEAKNTNSNIQTENTETETDKPAGNSSATPTEAYKSAFAARQKKDIKGLKNVLSKKMLEFFTEMGKMDNETLDDQLKKLAETPQAAKAEVRSEKITGDKATLEYLDENGKWKPMDFVKEDGGWKLTMPNSPPINREN